MRGLWSLVLLPLWAAVLLGSLSEAKHTHTPSHHLREARKAVAVGARGEVVGVRQKNPKGLKKPSPFHTAAKAPRRKVSKTVKSKPKSVARANRFYKSKRTHHAKKPTSVKPIKRVAKKTRSEIARKAKAKVVKTARMVRAPQKPPAKVKVANKKVMRKPINKKATPKAKTQVLGKKSILKAVPQKAKPRHGAKKPLSMFEAQRAAFLTKYAWKQARRAMQVPVVADANPTVAATATAVTNGPANLVPQDGQGHVINDNDVFVKEFTIEFKVKFDHFNRNIQMLVSTDKHALEIQALGPKYGVNSTKIGAYMRTESGLGPDGHGVHGCDGKGQLMSHALSPNQWYDVKFQKTPKLLSLTVGGKTVSSPFPQPSSLVIIKDTDFDLEAGSSKVVAGNMAGSGDIGLAGQLGDFKVTEGSAEVAPPVADAAAGDGR